MLGSINQDGKNFKYDRGYGFYADQENPNFSYIGVTHDNPQPSYMSDESDTMVSRYKRFYLTETQYIRVKAYAKSFASVAGKPGHQWRSTTNNCNTFVKNVASMIGLNPSHKKYDSGIPDNWSEFLDAASPSLAKLKQ